MKKIALAAMICAISLSAHAHRVWVSADHTHGGEILKAELGYGEFPEFEEIAKERLNIFKPMTLITDKGKEELVQKGKYNYQYQSKKPVQDGSYLVVGEYQPTFWSKNAAGWKRTNMTEMTDATYCEQTRMYGKHIANVGHESASKDIISKPLGHLLEIVPLDNPANVHVGDKFKVKVLYKGEPLPNVTLTATFDGFDTSDRSKITQSGSPSLFRCNQRPRRSEHHSIASRFLESQCGIQNRLCRPKSLPKRSHLQHPYFPNWTRTSLKCGFFDKNRFSGCLKGGFVVFLHFATYLCVSIQPIMRGTR